MKHSHTESNLYIVCECIKFGPNQTQAEANKPLAQLTCTRSELDHHISDQVTMLGSE